MPECIERTTIYESEHVCLYTDKVRLPSGFIEDEYLELLRTNGTKDGVSMLALSYAELKHTKAEATLNFRENPGFKYNTIEINSRYDRILLRNTYPQGFPILKNCTVFGQTVYNDINLAASDHYGVVVEMQW